MGARLHRAIALATAATSCLVLTGCEAHDLPLPGSPVDEDRSFTVTAEFRDVLNLVPRSQVMVNDVPVGEVVALERKGWHAAATLRIRDTVTLPENAVAEIRQTSLLGEKYVALQAPTDVKAAGRLDDGDEIPLPATGRNPELEEVLGALSLLLSGGGVGQLKTITAEVNRAFSGREEQARHVLGELEKLTAALDEQKGDIITAMEGINGLSGTLNEERRTIGRALDSFGPAVRTLSDQHTELIGMLGELDRLGAVSTRVLDRTKDQLLADLRHLRPVLHELNRVGDKLPDAVGMMVSFPFPYDSDPIVKGDYANTEVIFSINLQNFLEAGAPPGSGPPDLDDLLGQLPLEDLLGELGLGGRRTDGGRGGTGGGQGGGQGGTGGGLLADDLSGLLWGGTT